MKKIIISCIRFNEIPPIVKRDSPVRRGTKICIFSTFLVSRDWTISREPVQTRMKRNQIDRGGKNGKEIIAKMRRRKRKKASGKKNSIKKL